METWHNVQNVPKNDPSTGARLDHLFDVCRYRFNGMKMPGGSRYVEYKVVCQHGEVYPVGVRTWAWCGDSTFIANRVMRVLGSAAKGPFGGEPVLGSAQDESVIWFGESKVEEVLAVAKARRRRAPGNAGNLKRKEAQA